MSFSSDSRLLAVQNGAPDWNLVVWHWERAKLMGSARTANGNGDPITQVFRHSDATADPLLRVQDWICPGEIARQWLIVWTWLRGSSNVSIASK